MFCTVTPTPGAPATTPAADVIELVGLGCVTTVLSTGVSGSGPPDGALMTLDPTAKAAYRHPAR
jgi:hypothetical protein